MAKEGSRKFGFMLLVAMASGLPTTIIGEKLALGDKLPVQTMAFMFVAYAMGLVWAV